MRAARLTGKIFAGGIALCIGALAVGIFGWRYELSKYPPAERKIMADQDWLVGMRWVWSSQQKNGAAPLRGPRLGVWVRAEDSESLDQGADCLEVEPPPRFGRGIVMSTGVTVPKLLRGRSCPFVGPTTRTAS